MAKAERCGDDNQCPESWKVWDDSEYTLPDTCDEIEGHFCSPVVTDLQKNKKQRVNPMAQITKEAHMMRLNQLEKSNWDQRTPATRRHLKPWREISLPPKLKKKRSEKKTPKSIIPQPAEKPEETEQKQPKPEEASEPHEKLVEKPAETEQKQPKPEEAKLHEKLVQPLQKHVSSEKSNLSLTPYEMKFLEPSERIMKLVALKMLRESPKPVTRGAMRYTATERIKQLAKARERPPGKRDPKENPFAVQVGAFLAKTTPRLEKLAQPRKYIDIHTRFNPHLVSKAALKAKATSRISQLAQPKQKGHWLKV